MNRILWIDRTSMVVRIEAGAIGVDIQRDLEKEVRWLLVVVVVVVVAVAAAAAVVVVRTLFTFCLV